MEIIKSLKEIKHIPESIVTVGTFDGIHLAHQSILEKVIYHARNNNYISTVVTFDPHPRLVVRQFNGKKVRILTTADEKIILLSSYEIDRVIVIPFTIEFSSTSPEDFIHEILCKKIGLKRLVIGCNHGFGKNRYGDSELIKKYAKSSGFDVEIQESISNEFGVISSSLIRKFLMNGEVEKANICLGRSYNMIGKVVPGDKRGRILSYPTANIKITDSDKCIPQNGVYIVNVDIKKQKFNGVMNIGVRPTFNKSTKVLEMHILDFNQDIYDAEITVEFLQHKKKEKNFDSAEALQNQIEKDVHYAQNYFEKSKNN